MNTKERLFTKAISIEEIIAEDIIWLDKAVEKDYHEVTVEDILDGVKEGRFKLWRFGENKGVAVTTIFQWPKGTELYVAFLSGEGYFKNFASFISEMEEVAKGEGCRWFAGMADRKGTKKVYSLVGKSVGELYIREIRR